MDLNGMLRTQWDRTTAIGCTALGALLLLIGWIGVSGTPFLAEQAPYILSGGVGGIFLLGVGATLWISADLRDEWRKLDRIEAALLEGTLRFVDEEPVEVLPSQQGDVDVDAKSIEMVDEAPSSRRRGTSEETEVLASPVRPAKAARSSPARRTSAAVPAGRTKRPRAGVEHA
jgi:hypothetical protein